MVETYMKNIDNILENMTLEEKAYILSGTNFMYTNEIKRLGIPAICTSDGPHGLRKQTEGTKDNGVSTSEPATSFPTAAATASGWNTDNLYKMGEAIGKECGNYDVDVLLGPGVNIKRNPLCGRNFEYFSEDPYLAGCMGIAYVKGVMSQHVDVSVKHFALNNSENYRFMGNSLVEEDAAREIYLKPFEMIVKHAKPKTLMCAYNQINGTFCSQNKWLLTDVLRNEWGFDGIVMSDWGASKDREAGVQAGMELEMPGDTNISKKMIIDAVNTGRLSHKDLDICVKRMLEFIDHCEQNRRKRNIKSGMLTDEMRDTHHRLAAEVAADCAVLLKNKNNILPVNKSDNRELLVVGELFEKMRYQGSGSSMIHPARLTTPKDAFDRRNVTYTYCQGYLEEDRKDNRLLEQAVETSRKMSEEGVILVFCGLTDFAESEGADRETLALPANQLSLINKLILTGKKIVIILYGGSVMELPFEEHVDAILDMFLPGQAGGEATAALLFGEKCPCGHLAETWVNNYGDVPFGDEFGKYVNEVYKEGLYVGYRYYETNQIPVRFPFGYGLSYTEFQYDSIQICKNENKLVVTTSVKNTGAYDGAEVVQCYVSAPEAGSKRPVRELKAFQKVYLHKGEAKVVTLCIPYIELMHFNPDTGCVELESGRYTIQLMKNAHEKIIEDQITINGEISAPCKVHNYKDKVSINADTRPADPEKFPITLESRFTDLKQTFMGRILFHTVLSVAEKSEKEAKALPAGTERDNKMKGAIFLRRILESNSIRTMSMSAGKSFPYNMALGMRDMANGHIIKGIKHMLSPIKVVKMDDSKKS